MQQVHRAPRLANLQAEVDSELEVELAEDVDEELARDEKRGREQEAARKTAKQASEKAKPRKPTANKPGWTMNKWLEKILAKAKNLLADVPIPAISFPVVPLIEYSAQPQIPPRAKTYQDDKHWDEVTMDEAKDARKATDKNTDSYSDDEGWEVVDRQSGDEKDAKKAEIARIDYMIKQTRRRFNGLKEEPIMMVEEMHDLNRKTADLEKKKKMEKLEAEMEGLGWTEAKLG